MRQSEFINGVCVANLKGLKAAFGKRFFMIFTIAVMMVLGGCGSPDIESGSSGPRQDDVTLTIMAAASLTEMFTEVESVYEASHPNVDLVFSFAGSQALATQIIEGVEADVFASANTKYVDNLISEGLVKNGDTKTFAKNKLAIILGKDLEGIETYEDIIQGDYKIVIADETVPVGKYTITFLDQVEASYPGYTAAFNNLVVSKETNVKLVASKVELGEADLGIVYMTDLTSANQDLLKIIEIPNEVNVIATYPIAKLSHTENEEASEAFVTYMLSDEGKSILEKHGFTVGD